MLDDIREWISDNLRWILLGVSAILAVVILVVAIRTVMHIAGGGKTQQESQTNAQQEGSGTSTEKETAGSAEDETAASSGSSSSEALTKDQADVLEAAKSYWTAIKNNDFDTLESLCGKTYDDEARKEVEKTDLAVESYSDITTYSKAGLTNGSYVVYVYMELNLTGIETSAPRLTTLYMEPGSDGSLKVIDDYSNEISAYVESCTADDDVQALVEDVNNTLAERRESDADLDAYVISVSKNQTESESAETDSTEAESAESAENSDAGTATGTMTVSVEGGANVRSEPSTDGTLVASLAQGSSVEVLENLDSGWSRIQFINSSGSTVEGYMMTEFLSQ